jgi:hypothetical protein
MVSSYFIRILYFVLLYDLTIPRPGFLILPSLYLRLDYPGLGRGVVELKLSGEKLSGEKLSGEKLSGEKLKGKSF